MTELLRARPDEAYLQTLARAWTAIRSPRGLGYLRLFSPMHDSASRLLPPDFRKTATTDWLPLLEEGLASVPRGVGAGDATLVLSVIRGLLMDLDATGDASRADMAFGQLIKLLHRDAFDRRGGGQATA